MSSELAGAARRAGAALAAQARRLAGRRPGRRRLVDAAIEALARQGYEPRRDGAGLQLVNCPFETVTQEHRGVVCPVNLALLEAFAGGLDVGGFTPRAGPGDGRCCVVIEVEAGTGGDSVAGVRPEAGPAPRGASATRVRRRLPYRVPR